MCAKAVDISKLGGAANSSKESKTTAKAGIETY